MAKKRKTPAACKCIAAVNKELAKQNAALDTDLSFDFSTMNASLVIPLPLRKLDASKRGALPTMVCTYCPICGTRLTP